MLIRRVLPVLLLVSGLAHAAGEPSGPPASEGPYKASATLGFVPDFDLDSGGTAGATNSAPRPSALSLAFTNCALADAGELLKP